MAPPNTNPSTNDPDRFERDRRTPKRDPSSVADDRPSQRRNRIADDDPLIDEAEVRPENDFDDEGLGRSDR